MKIYDDDEINRQEVVAVPILLNGDQKEYMLYADMANGWSPTLMTDNDVYRLLKKELFQEFDLIASFMQMKVPRGKTFEI